MINGSLNDKSDRLFVNRFVEFDLGFDFGFQGEIEDLELSLSVVGNDFGKRMHDCAVGCDGYAESRTRLFVQKNIKKESFGDGGTETTMITIVNVNTYGHRPIGQFVRIIYCGRSPATLILAPSNLLRVISVTSPLR